MSKVRKILISVIMSFLLVVQLIPLQVFAETGNVSVRVSLENNTFLEPVDGKEPTFTGMLMDTTVTVPNGSSGMDAFKKALDKEGIEYKVVPQLKSNDYFLMLKDGEDVTYYCIDIQGDETAHLIQGLNSGEKYILRETLTPCGYATAKEQIFEIREKNIVLKVVDEDIKVDISKKDITNNKELSGAHLQVKNEDGEVLDSWISTDQEHRICHLEVGKKYILEETMAPYGYEKSEKVEFVIKDTGEIQKVIMYDQPIIQAIKTGDSSKLNYFIMLGALSGICIFLCRKRDVKSPKSK